ncbi:MAG: MBOAT family O-acyltransferase [Chthoniobacter sp.]|nr:MBOAT family O-acyltransferase [Chthoniobacter sp.]
MSAFPWALAIFYILAGRVIIRSTRGVGRQVLFAALNLASFYWFFVHGRGKRETLTFGIYLGIVLVQYLTMRILAEKKDWKMWVAFLTPILALVLIRYVPVSLYAHVSGGFARLLREEPAFSFAPYFLGISYLAFRASHLVLEVRNGAVEKPGIWEYFGFCFFVPTMSVGPINPYHHYRQAFASEPPSFPLERSLTRILVGLVKYQFLGKLCDQLTYSGLLMDEHYHRWMDLPVAAVFYYLYLFCNFSGVCDVAIGVAGLMGIPVAENFQSPFGARNVKEFWNRWHITLSLYLREVVFVPLSKFLAHLFGPANVNHAIAGAITVTFLLVGLWHGLAWNFILFGALHALGNVVNHYYTIGLKKWLGAARFKAYNANPYIRAAAVVVTFCYVAATMFCFANSLPEMKDILSSLR